MVKATKEPAARKRHTGTAKRVLAYMTGNADRPVTAADVAEATGDVETSAASAMAAMAKRYPQMRRVQKGIYIWDSSIKEAETGEYMVKVLSRKEDGTMLVQDEEHGDVFVMRPVEF